MGSKSFTGTILHPATPTIFSFEVAEGDSQAPTVSKDLQDTNAGTADADLERLVREDLEQVRPSEGLMKAPGRLGEDAAHSLAQGSS